MFGTNSKKIARQEKYINDLQERVEALHLERHELIDENEELRLENKKLKQKRQIEEEQIAHKLRMREEQIIIDKQKEIATVERSADERVAGVKDQYRDKVEKQLEKRGDELKTMYSEILTRLPDVSLAITQESGKRGK